MKTLTKYLGIAGISALSFLPMKEVEGQSSYYRKDTIVNGKKAHELIINLKKDSIDYHYVSFVNEKDSSLNDEVVYSTIFSDGAKMMIKDSLYDKKLDYFLYMREGNYPILLKNNTEIENATKEKEGISRKEIYDYRDRFEIIRIWIVKD